MNPFMLILMLVFVSVVVGMQMSIIHTSVVVAGLFILFIPIALYLDRNRED